MVRVFAQNRKVVELNGNSANVRRDGIPNMRLLLEACARYGCRIAVNSDAHSVPQLQNNTRSLSALLDEVQFPQALVVNAMAQNLINELKTHGRACADEIGGIVL